MEELKPSVEVHQKYCQTDIKEFNDQYTQTEIETVDFGVQVHISEPPLPPREEKIPIMERLDWNVRESYDYNSKPREVNDLRWSLSNSSQKRWNRGVSPSSQDQDDRIMLSSPSRLSHQDHDSREYIHRIQSPIRHSDSYSSNRGRNHRSFSPRERHFSPDFRQNSYHENRNERSREPSPIMLDDHDDVEILEQEPFSHDPNWRGRNNKSFGQNPPVHKSRSARGKHSTGRPFRGRGGGGSSSYRGKY
ncbi:hypothetical protein KQX54_006774 [Cotesia glomerata]|uniref:Uncharacterized protein n=2 Tax=Cotesia glomerata TaxID=32391 RepID=A0AAV7IIT0_COTGL|nr:hypothetical protein KQX54_006774 [Cotesia glomerata]